MKMYISSLSFSQILLHSLFSTLLFSSYLLWSVNIFTIELIQTNSFPALKLGSYLLYLVLFLLEFSPSHFHTTSSFSSPCPLIALSFPYFLLISMFFSSPGLEPGDVSYKICGYTATATDVVSVCLSSTGICTAKAFKEKTCAEGVNMYMFDTVRTSPLFLCFLIFFFFLIFFVFLIFIFFFFFFFFFFFSFFFFFFFFFFFYILFIFFFIVFFIYFIFFIFICFFFIFFIFFFFIIFIFLSS